ncbi:hypothetical protein OG713_44025 [Streptomyces sp. NBC_00723]
MHGAHDQGDEQALDLIAGERDQLLRSGVPGVAEGRGFPGDASQELRAAYTPYSDSSDVHGTTHITWAELASADWKETDSSGVRSRDMAARDQTHWEPVWSVMRTLGELHGAQNVRLVVWFH